MLEIKGLTKNFGGLCAVNSLDLTINKGDFVGLIGPNGAGKTTVFNLVTGFIRPTRGRIIFENKDITGKGPHSIAKRGIVRTFQGDRIFSEYTVLQNVVAACFLDTNISLWEAALHTPSCRKKEEYTLNRANEIMQFTGIEKRKDVYVVSTFEKEGWFACRFVPFQFAEEPHLLTLFADITDRKTAEDEIKKRVKELEDFHEIAIGRELRMIELKERIKELERKLAECKKK